MINKGGKKIRTWISSNGCVKIKRDEMVSESPTTLLLEACELKLCCKQDPLSFAWIRHITPV